MPRDRVGQGFPLRPVPACANRVRVHFVKGFKRHLSATAGHGLARKCEDGFPRRRVYCSARWRRPPSDRKRVPGPEFAFSLPLVVVMTSFVGVTMEMLVLS